MTILYAALLTIYATGCMAAIVECTHQYAEASDTHPARRMQRNHPIANVFAISAIIVGWPLILVWFAVREMLR